MVGGRILGRKLTGDSDIFVLTDEEVVRRLGWHAAAPRLSSSPQGEVTGLACDPAEKRMYWVRFESARSPAGMRATSVCRSGGGLHHSVPGRPPQHQVQRRVSAQREPRRRGQRGAPLLDLSHRQRMNYMVPRVFQTQVGRTAAAAPPH
jgi:hypothetical protein